MRKSFSLTFFSFLNAFLENLRKYAKKRKQRGQVKKKGKNEEKLKINLSYFKPI